jgi:hypothetical protein
MAAAARWSICSLIVAGETQIIFLLARCRLQQLILVVGGVRIVARQAISNRRGMNVPFDLRGVFIAVAGEAYFVGCGRDQLYMCDIPVDPNFVAAQASHRDGGMNRFALGFVFVAGKADCGVGLWIERDRMLRRTGLPCKTQNQNHTGEALDRPFRSR